MSTPPGAVLLGTVALEPNRWATVDTSGAPMMAMTDWSSAIGSAGFDGLELWERHATDAADGAAALLDGPVPIVVLSSYVSLDDPDPAPRAAVADWAVRLGAGAVKVNVGRDPSASEAYSARLAELADALPAEVVVLCECHAGTIAEDPIVAAAILGAAGSPQRVQAIVHTHESIDHLRTRFAAYGDRITHVHVNHLDPATLAAPPLVDVRADLAAKVAALGDLGFRGSWTIEFVHGVLGPDDRPEVTLPQAVADLAVLRDVLGEAQP